jgi:hypothetical protein
MLLSSLNDTRERELAISRCLEATDDWVSNAGLVALYAGAAEGTSSSDAASTKFALLLRAADQGSCYARALATLGSLLGGPNVETFKD